MCCLAFNTSACNTGNGGIWGKGLPKDVAQALSWYGKAAEAGNGLAMFNLGSIYEEKQDITQAIRWYRLAEKAGVDEASKRIESLSNEASDIK